MHGKHYTIPVFIPEIACPFQCVFCNQHKITGKLRLPTDAEIVHAVNTHLQTFKEKKRVVEVGFFGGNFTGIPFEQQKHLLGLVQPFLKNGQIQGIRISTRPDYIDEKILNLLKLSNVSTIELGAQSFDDGVLKASFRGHSSGQTERAAKLILEQGFALGLQMMIGLPGDTFEKSLHTARRIVALEASSTRIYPTVVIRDTTLHQWYKSGKYAPLTMEEAILRTKALIPLFEEAGVRILRAGLHPSEGLLDGKELVAGPFHPSFKELVLTAIWADLLRPLLDREPSESIEIRVPEKEINFAIGHGAENRKMLEIKFGRVRYVPDVTLTGRDFNTSAGSA